MNKKLGIGVVVVCAIVAVAMFTGCIEEEEVPAATPTPTASPTPTPVVTPSPTPSPTPTPFESPRWDSIMFKRGGDDRYRPHGVPLIKTELFYIRGDKWRITYKVEASPDHPEDSTFEVHVLPRGEDINSERYISRFTCHGKSCSDVQYIYEGKEHYYLGIASNRNTWELEVEDYCGLLSP